MNPQQNPSKARKACLRCRRSKRRCDRAMPKCLLCKRRQEDCEYETITLSISASVPSSDTDSAIFLEGDDATSRQLKTAIVKKLSVTSPKDIKAVYIRSIKPWLPIIVESKLDNQFPSTWDDATLDFTLLCLSIMLFGICPKPSIRRDTEDSDLMPSYLSTKSWISLVEGIGINSIEVVQSRLFITLFEVCHGLYPAAYISIGAAARAAEALEKSRSPNDLSLRLPTKDEKVEERMTWGAVKILDRYIAIESGESPPVTRRIHQKEPDLPYSQLAFSICPALLSAPSSHLRQFLRLFEATNLLDKVHITIYEPTPRISFNVEEAALLVKTLSSLKTIICEELPDNSRVHASGLLVCITGLLLIFDKCDKERSFNYDIGEHRNSTTTLLDAIIEDIHNIIKPLQNNLHEMHLDLDRIPPFASFMIYKAATVVTDRLREQSNSKKYIGILRSLRDFLEQLNSRWLAAGRYLALLNEDTTPRILKALEKEAAET